MAREIADSDDESDVIGNDAAAQASERKTPFGNIAPPAERESPPQIDFDEFLNSTQALSDQSPIQTGAPGRGTGSTEKILRSLAHAQQNLGASSTDNEADSSGNTNGKRRHSASEGGPPSFEAAPGKKKRVKTYGSKSKSGSTIDLFADVNTPTQHMSSLSDKTPADVVVTQPYTAIEPDEQPEGVATARERDRPRRVISLLGQVVNTPGQQLSTTMSSYGNYQSYELDFRGASGGIDVNSNPFGGISQLSQNEAAEASVQGDVEKEMMTSPERAQNVPSEESINPALLVQNDPLEEVPSIERPFKRRKIENIGRGTTASPAPSSRRAVSVSAESVSNMSDKSQPKKRGRKAKGSKLANSSQQEAMAPPDPPDTSTSKRQRRGTLDSTQASHDETPSNTKRKRKKSKLEDSPSKQPSSELHLDDEKVIGLPTEKYKPRPSRRRSRAIDEEEQEAEVLPEVRAKTPVPAPVEQEAEPQPKASSPTKQPTSELHLDDEQVIGLPAENYKPRPSRRRSRQVVDDDEPKEPDWTGPLPDIPENIHPDRAEPKSPPKSTKKGRKSKVKRAKTSAAALLKKSSQMLSDGEDDVLWVDEKPAPVKLDLPPALKTEDTKAEEESEAEIATPKRKNKISVEITVPKQPSPQAGTAKKKRGRPKKLVPSDPALDKAPTPEPLTDVEGIAEAVVHEEDDDEEEIKTTTRPVLKPKDPNARSAPPVSPAKLPPAKDKENATPTPSPTKGPTSHSPINPSSGWNSKSRYRLGLSKRQSIPSLLRKVDKAKVAPTKVGVKIKERKVKEGVDNGSDDDEKGNVVLRDKNGELVEWEF